MESKKTGRKLRQIDNAMAELQQKIQKGEGDAKEMQIQVLEKSA